MGISKQEKTCWNQCENTKIGKHENTFQLNTQMRKGLKNAQFGQAL